jgi:hypothetical protein
VIDLAGLEAAAYGRTADRWARVTATLEGLVAGGTVDATRAVAAIGAVIADPDVALSEDDILRGLVMRQELENLFRASAFGGADHFLHAMGLQPRGGAPPRLAVTPAALARAFLLISLDSQIEFTADDVFALPPALAQMAFIALASSKPLTTSLAQQRREELLARANDLAPAPLPLSVNHIVALSSAWMLSSYASHPGKHAIKPVLNRSLVDVAKRITMPMPAGLAPREFKARPRMVVAAEIMHSNHVQYRYFGQYLRQLRQRFELILLTEDKEADPAARALFDQTITFARGVRGEHLHEIARHLIALQPDIVFYPSVGMRHWGPLLANVRFAPIQMTALGHSASTFIPTMDYYLTEEGYVSDPALFGERLLLLPDEALVFERSPHYTPAPPQIRDHAEPLRVALPSNLLKLNPSFLALLARIRAASPRELEFHAFPNAGGRELRAVARVLSGVLPGSRVHGVMAYNAYLERLSACDLNLSPFPFGGLHSVIDSLRQGLPVVAMECPEPHGRTDAMLLRRLGMPDWLIVQDEGQYQAAALRLIGDDALRVDVSRQALALDLDRLMFGDDKTPLRSEVADAVWWAYRNHDAVVAEDRRAIRPADWSVL